MNVGILLYTSKHQPLYSERPVGKYILINTHGRYFIKIHNEIS